MLFILLDAYDIYEFEKKEEKRNEICSSKAQGIMQAPMVCDGVIVCVCVCVCVCVFEREREHLFYFTFVYSFYVYGRVCAFLSLSFSDTHTPTHPPTHTHTHTNNLIE